MIANWIQSQLSFHAPALWLFLSLGLSGLLWLSDHLSAQWQSHENGHIRQNHIRLQLAQWVLLPYIGLMLGGLSPRLMGLVDVDWLVTLELGAGLFFAILFLLVLVRATSASASSETQATETQATETNRTDLMPIEMAHERGMNPPLARPPTIQWQPILFDLLWTGAKEFHWSFLRGAIWELLLFAPIAIQSPAYWAIWIAAFFALPSIFIQGFVGIERIIQVILLIATSILFFYTRNFWLCWALHATAHLVLMPRNRPHNYTTKAPDLHYQNEI